MPLFTSEQLRNRARNEIRKGGYTSNTFQKSKQILNESREYQESDLGERKNYDIFLSHSTDDAEEVLGLSLLLKDLGYSVYIDWIEDPQLNRSNVNKHTAHLLKERMKQSDCLIYAFSKNATQSKWMPWELGYFDGIKGKVAILPIAQSSSNNFKGTEYLSIYYYVDIDGLKGTNKSVLWVNDVNENYISFNSWKDHGFEPFKHPYYE